VSKYRKFITALIAAALTCAAIFLTPEQYPAARDLITVIVSLLGALGVYVVKNEEPR
jgi:hypothetical protein